jgi:hypothetical protein
LDARKLLGSLVGFSFDTAKTYNSLLIHLAKDLKHLVFLIHRDIEQGKSIDEKVLFNLPVKLGI